MFRQPIPESEYINRCHHCNKPINENDLVEGLYCDDCAEIIIYGQYTDILD